MNEDFRKIKFGWADAHTEGIENPDLLKRGYINISNVVSAALGTNTFLFLGYKGSGKSALSEHLRLSSLSEIVVDQQKLKDFPFSFFDKIYSSNDKLLRYKTIWKYLLCVKIVSFLYEDEESRIKNKSNIDSIIDILSREGLFPIHNISDLLSKSTSSQIKVAVQGLELSHCISRSENTVDIEMLTSFLLSIISNFTESNNHIIVIDDLDDILQPKGVQFYIISALINEVNDLNNYFVKNNIPLKIIVLCRSDMFEKLPDPNNNKIKQDKSFTFSWYKEGSNPENSELINLINLRTQLIYPDIKNTFCTFFPKKYKDKNIEQALLEYTRHTPRDFVQLISYIQKQCTSKRVMIEDIDNGIKEYSSEYFRLEIKNEISGYVPVSAIDPLFALLSSFHKPEFYYSEFVDKAKKNSNLKKLDLDEILNVLYNCSAIGHKYDSSNIGITKIQFKYRNRTSSFLQDNLIRVHKGLWKALDLGFYE